jgi:hypothetical protein
MSSIDKKTELLGCTFVLVSTVLLLCWVFKKSNCMSYGRDFFSNKYVKGVYVNKRNKSSNDGTLHDLETVPVNRPIDKRERKPYVDLKWKSESMVGINNHEEINSYRDFNRLNNQVGPDLVTVPPNGLNNDFGYKDCLSIGGVMMKNVDYDPNDTMNVHYAPARGYVSI